MPTLTFLGAAGTVTGSRHLVEHAGRRILLDCGLFQGEKPVRRRNWDPFPVPPSDVDAVVLSHAHVDHIGWLPRLVRHGFRGPIWCTRATRDLAQLLLPDSGRLQEEEARYALKKRFSRHERPEPLYTEAEAVACLELLRTLRYDEPREIAPGSVLRYRRAGHILGSALVRLDLAGEGAPHTLVFSGDIGRYDMPVIPDPDPVEGATTLLVECTYGDRRHDDGSPRDRLCELVQGVIDRRQVMVVPAFAIGRTQDLLYHLRQLQLAGRLPALPVCVDSPMACDATPLFLLHREEHDEEMARELADGSRPLEPDHVRFVRGVEESKALNDRKGPLLILSASGMATGGRILHHLANRLPDPDTVVLFVGFQAAGSRGRKLLDGAASIRIHGMDVPVHARIESIRGFSAHADCDEVDRWLGGFARPPSATYCVHGEAGALEATRARLAARGWNAVVPEHGQTVALAA